MLQSGHLLLSVMPEPAEGFVLDVDGTGFASADATLHRQDTLIGYRWTASELSWAKDDTVALSLSWVEAEGASAQLGDQTKSVTVGTVVVKDVTPPPTPTPMPVATAPPARPTGLSATASSHDSVGLTWNDPGDATITHYQVFRRDTTIHAIGEFITLAESTGSADTTYTDETVEPETKYVYRVKALNAQGASSWSSFSSARTPAAPPPPPAEDLAPTGLAATLADGGGVSLSWTAPAEDTDNVSGYEILRAVGDGALTTLVADTGNTATTYTDATASEAGETYAYEVKAIRGEERSQASGEAQVQVPHDAVDLAPTGLTAVVLTMSLAVVGEDSTTTSTSVSLSWTAPAEDADSVTGYEILRAVGEGAPTTLVADTSSTATMYIDATASEAGETYAYQVKAIRGEDRSQESGEAHVQVPHDAVDLAPSGLTATLVEGGGVALTWTAPSEDADGVTGYEILRAVGEGALTTLVAGTGSTATTYSDATATEAGESYAYQVKAIRGEERSQASGQSQVQLPHDPADLAPTGLTASVFSVVLREEGSTASVSVYLNWDAPAEDAGSVTGYEILRAVGDGELATLVADTESTETVHTDASATTAGERYAYQVKAIRDGVHSQASAEASVALPAATVVTCEFDAGGGDLPADTGTACALAVGGSVRGETSAAGDVDWYRVGLQALATYQFDMRGKSTGEWQLVDGVPAFVSVGTLEDPKLLGIYDASGALVAGTDSEVAGTGKDSRIASFSPDADGVYYISASAESGWTGTYELSVTVTAGENAEDMALLAPSGLGIGMVRNRLTLIWKAPAEDAASVTGYEILRAEGEAEPATLLADTASTATTYRDETATQAGTTYTYAVKALRGDEASGESPRVSYSLPPGYAASTKELASKVYVHSQVVGETLEFAPQVVVQPDQDRQTIWTGDLILGFNSFYSDTGTSPSGSLAPNTFIFNGTTYKVAFIGLVEGYTYIPGTSYYAYDVRLGISPALDAATYATWRFMRPGGEFNLVDALVTTVTRNNQQFQQFEWPETHWDPPLGTTVRVSLTGVGGTVGSTEPETDPGPPGIKLSWTTKRLTDFASFSSKPVKVGFEIYRYERNLWGNFTSGEPRVGEVLNCDIDESDGAESCLNVPGVRRLRQSWTWTDETAQSGVSYLYTIKPYHEFYSGNGRTVWSGVVEDVVAGDIAQPAHRVRIYGRSSNVSHRMPHADAPGTPTNLQASQPNSGTCTGSCVRLTWDPAPNAAKYVVFRVGQRTRETWVDNGLTYPQQRFHPADPDLTVPEWEDTSAEPGVNYGYRVAAFNADGLRSPDDAVVGIETRGGATVPNRVRSLTAEATLKDRVTNTAQTVAGDQSLNTSTRERFAQRFKTGGTSGKVRLRWIAVKFGEIRNVSTAPDVLEATVNTVSGSVPGTVECTLTDPATYVSEEVNRYHASSCDLDANTAYFFVLKRTGGTATIELAYTTSLSEDLGSSDWRIADSRYRYDSAGSGTWSSANQVHLIEVIHAPSEAEVTLNWTAPVGQSNVTGYEVQYRLDIPEKGEWDDDWKTLRTEAANAVSSTHTIALEKYYSRRNFYPTGAPTFSGTVAQGQTLTADTSGISDPDGLTNPDFSYQWFLNRAPVSGETGSTFGPLTDIHARGNIALRVSFTDDKGNRESLVSGASPRVDPVEYVPTADKGTLRLNDTENDTDTTNDLILPFGITYEYRVRAVNGTNKGLPADKEGVRIPNQDGLPPVVIIEARIQRGP